MQIVNDVAKLVAQSLDILKVYNATSIETKEEIEAVIALLEQGLEKLSNSM